MTTNGQYGIFLYYSSQNLIYHNNFANNFGQAYATPPDYANAWDDDYPSGGNYWSDYAGADLFSGEYQNETGSDGMWDHPRVIDLDNQDRYPLVTPWTLRPPPALEWNTTYGGMEFDDAVALVTTSDGGYALAGLTQSFGAESGDFWLVKTDYVGTVQWNRTYGGTNNYDELYGLVQTNDGGYVLVGYTNYPNGGLDAWLVKTDASGTMQWNQTYGGADSDMAFALVETTDGGYALAGMTLSFGVGNGDFWLVKIDANGGMQWNKTYGGTGGDQAYALVQTADGGYALAGYTRYLGGNDRDFWLVKTDSYGNAQWNRTYGGTNVDSAEALVETTDGGYALAGWTDSFGAGGWDAWLVKTDASGTMQWNQSYGGADIDEALALVETTDGGYALAGYTCSSGAGGPDAWLVRTDANGIEQWNQTYGGTDSDYAWALVQTADGGYALAGETWSFGAGDADAWLVKIDASGNLPVHNINTGLCYVTIQEAINAPETLDGHTIFVESGTYYENVILNKSIRLMGEGRSITSISSQEGVVVSVEANNVSLSGFTIETYGAEYGAEGVVIRSVNHCNVTGNTIRSCQVGLGLISSSYVEVIGNEIVDNEYALNIESSDYDNISENYVGSNINGGIYLCLSVSNTISNNTVTNSEFGVFIEESANNTFYGNIITANSNMGVDLWYSTNNTLKDNIMISNLYNFGVEGETLSHFTNDVDSSNTVDGKPIHYWTNQLNTAIPLDAGYVALVNCVDISVEGLTLKNNLQGLLLFSTMNSQMTNNIIANNCDGFRLCKSSNNTISGNNITEKEFGILLEESSDNEISCNNISGSMTSTNEIGIYAWDSSNNSIFGNNITNNWYDGIGLDSCSNNSVCDNNIVGSAGGIYVDGSFNTISGNHITGSDWSGIFMVGSNNSISGNIIANNRIGIDLLYSANNSVSRNSIVANYEFGVIFYGSSNNSIYHNDFIDNTAQARSIDSINDWDDGYLSGGNYWSDYTNADICSGPYQNETGSDGIGDTPCTIDAYNQDNYPLMGPWTGVGENVTITHASGVSLIFANVTSSGITTVNETQTGPDPPSRFKLATETPTYYDIKTTANYKGSIQIRIPYNDTGLTQGQENNLRLMHWNEIQQQWIDITTYVDTENNLIYGETSGLSMFSVMLSPNTAANNITFSRTVVSQGYSTTINVTIENQGGFAETFDFSLYANETIIESENVTLPAGNSTTITFTWNTTGFAYGNYTLSAYAWPVPDETNTADNNFTGGWVIVSLVGDITGPDGWPDGKCDMRDIGYVARRFMCKPGDPLWDPNADIDDNAKIDMKDIGTTARHFGEHLP
jgi:parallel beta-helix repeat protein